MFNLFSNHELTLFFAVASILSLFSLFVARNYSIKTLDNIIFFMIMAFFLILNFSRDGLGPDEPAYLEVFVAYKTEPSNFEYSFSLQAVYYIFEGLGVKNSFFNKWFVVLYLLSVVGTVCLLVRRPHKAIVLFAFLFSAVGADFAFNAYRQGFAICALMISLYFFGKKRYVLFLIFSMVGYGFHWTILIPYALFIAGQLISEKNILRLLYLGLFFHIVGMFINFQFLETVASLGRMLPSGGFLFGKIYSYIINGSNSFYDNNIFGKLRFMIPIFACYLMAIYNFNDLKKHAWFPMFTLLGLYSLLLIDMAYSFRNYYWFTPFFPFLLTNFYSNQTGKLKLSALAYFLYILIWAFLGFFSSSVMPMLFF